MTPISRREFAALAAGTVAAPFTVALPSATIAGITAEDVADRIRKQVGVEWSPTTVDAFKAGDPATAVTGIVTTAMATLDVLSRAVKTRANLVITSEPTFYSRSDNPTPPAGRGRGAPGAAGAGAVPTPGPAPDPVFAAKADFIRTHKLVIWRFNDHWRLRKPDPLVQGLADALGWSRLRSAEDPARVVVPAVTLDALASEIKKKLGARGGIRVVGAPQLNVKTVGLLPGTTAIQAALKMMPDVDVVIAGEVREWESVEYARDKVTAGETKGLILLGRVLSEDPGMNVCAQWLKTLVPEVTTTWIPVGDPYWRPV